MPIRVRSLEPTEADIQGQIIGALCHLGYAVLITSRVQRRCRQCGAWPPAADGASKGLPDLYARHPSWEPGVWRGLEVKSAKGRIRPEQRALAEANAIVIVRSVEEALAAVGDQRRIVGGCIQ